MSEGGAKKITAEGCFAALVRRYLIHLCAPVVLYCWPILYKMRVTFDMQPITATVVEAHSKKVIPKSYAGNRDSYKTNVYMTYLTYTYTVDGEVYKSSNLTFTKTERKVYSRTIAEDHVNNHPPGGDVTVYVNSKNPKQVVFIEPKKSQFWYSLLAVSGVTISYVTILFWHSIRERFFKRKPPYEIIRKGHGPSDLS